MPNTFTARVAIHKAAALIAAPILVNTGFKKLPIFSKTGPQNAVIFVIIGLANIDTLSQTGLQTFAIF